MRFRALTSLVALVAIAACSDSTSPNNNQQAGGTYTLQTINGSNIPYSYNSGSATITITGDSYTLDSDGTYAETINETISNGGSTSTASDAESGTWSQNGTAVLFTPTFSSQNNYTQYTGALGSSSTFSHSTLTFSYSGVVWVYEHD